MNLKLCGTWYYRGRKREGRRWRRKIGRRNIERSGKRWWSWKRGADREKDRNGDIGENAGVLKEDGEETGRNDKGCKGGWRKEEVRGEEEREEENKIMLMNFPHL